MYARIIHQLQILPILLVLFALIEFQPLFKWLSYDHMALTLSAIIGMSFLFTLGLKTKFKLLVLTIGLVSGFILVLNIMYLYPSLGILSLIFFMLTLLHIQGFDPLAAGASKVSRHNILVSYLIYLMPFFLISPREVHDEGLFFLAMILAGESVIYLSLMYVDRLKAMRIPLIALVTASALALFALGKVDILNAVSFVTIVISTAAMGFIFLRRETLRLIENQYTKIFKEPELIVIGYFVVAGLIGCFLLQLPIAQMNPSLGAHSLLDSLFTAISAICVTGLIVLDTPVDFTIFGQFVILLLIQFGGLGITSLSAWILLILTSGRLNISHEETLHSMSGHSAKLDIKSFIKRIFTYFVVIEFLGAVALFPAFLSLEGNWLKALWRAIFTSVSAFCNAGFALQSDSLIPYQNHAMILILISGLIIAGGFAPLMVLDFPKKIRQKRFSLQEKIVVATTLSLLLCGFFYFLFVEWDHSLAHLAYFDKFANAWFQSVTARTAGFNSVELTNTRTVSQMFLMLLMFIGGNPGSTSGGVKTVTIAVLAIAAFNALKESDEARVFYKRIPYKTIFRSLLVVFLGVAVHFVAFFFLSVTQNADPISLLFETFSALGTVGLSTGATVRLDEIGKMIIIFCMLAGRVGPLTFVLLLMKKQSHQMWKMPKEDVSIT